MASVIIRTFNEERYLPGLLTSLDRQSYRDFEVVVIDSGSLDHTREIAAGRVDNLLRIDSHDFTFGYSLNVGIDAAIGNLAVIVSAHTLPADEDWLHNLLKPFCQPSIAMTYGRQLGGDESNFSELQDLGRTFGSSSEIHRPPNFFAHNGNSAIRKSLWREHPFDENLPGLEDIEWAKYWMERGYQVAYDAYAALHHNHKEHWRQIRRRYFREAVAMGMMGMKSKWNIPLEVFKESRLGLLDLGCALFRVGNQVDSDTGLMEKSKEILVFRSNKFLGTAQGLLDRTTMQNANARHEIFFDHSCDCVVAQGNGRGGLEKYRIPDIKPGDVLVRTAYTGICGIDVQLFNGNSGYDRNGASGFPIIPGHEVSGIVVSVGSNVKNIEEGDPVVIESIQSCGTCHDCKRGNWAGCYDRAELGIIGKEGGFSQLVVSSSRYIHKVPSGLDLRRAALCEPLAIVLKGLNRLAQFWPTEPERKRCAVIGGGSFGHLCAKVLFARGHDVTVFDQDSNRRSYFEGSAISSSGDLNRLYEFEVLVEVTGDPGVLETLVQQSSPNATILILDLHDPDKHIFLGRFLSHDKAIVGSSGSTPQDFREALELLPQLNVDMLLTGTFPLERFRDALEAVETRRFLKVMLEFETV